MKIANILLVVAVAVVFVCGAGADAAKPGGKCPRDIMCPDVWDPVICDDGVVYSNSCYAFAACAKGCEPYGDGGPIVLEAAPDCPPKPKFCPKLWAPVICDDGKVYPNQCWADKKCATGCEPYGDWLLAAGGPDSDCPPKPKVCPKLWAPVICDNGKVYPNQCWADKKCALGCVPYDEGLVAGAPSDCPPKPKFCPKLWAPVICDDGRVYANQCWADKKCATGCEPYFEGAIAGGKKKPGGGDECPRIGYVCPDIYDPVICDDGEIYSNDCVAWIWCATGCEPLGPGPIPVEP